MPIVFYFLNSFSYSIGKDTALLFLSITLIVLMYPLILGEIKTNGLLTSSKYPVKYLELVFVLTNFRLRSLYY